MGSRLLTRVFPDRGWQLEQCGQCRLVERQLQQRGVELEHEHRGSPGERSLRSEAGRLRAASQYLSFGVTVQTHSLCDEDQLLSAASTLGRTWQEGPVLGDVMPKTADNLFHRITDFENLWAAYLAARKGKRYRIDTMRFAANLETNILRIRDDLVAGTWCPGNARCFRVYEPKWRDIQAPPFEDRVVHHALVRVVEPHFDRKFIYHSYACRKGKGAQKAVRAVQAMLRTAQAQWGSVYVFQGDVSKYFASINHDVFFGLVGRTISCRETVGLWRAAASGYGHDNGIGFPVGALTSQLGGNITLDKFDHLMTDDAGWGMYVRYMDDFIVITPTKDAANQAMRDARHNLQRLCLTLNPKSKVYPAKSGVDFAGYRVWSTHILPRKRNIRKARVAFRQLSSEYAKGRVPRDYIDLRVSSFLAYTKHCQAQRTTAGVLEDIVLTRSAP